MRRGAIGSVMPGRVCDPRRASFPLDVELDDTDLRFVPIEMKLAPVMHSLDLAGGGRPASARYPSGSVPSSGANRTDADDDPVRMAEGEDGVALGTDVVASRHPAVTVYIHVHADHVPSAHVEPPRAKREDDGPAGGSRVRDVGDRLLRYGPRRPVR